jgi:signal transduction histidine kinase
MAVVGMRLSALQASLPDDPASSEALARLQEGVASATGRLRHLLFELRPPSLDREGLRSAILEYAHADGRDVDQRVTVEDQLETEPPPEVRAVAYRILHEALATARKNTRAEEVTVRLESKDNGLYVRVSDDAVPTAPAPDDEGSWVERMRERAELAGGWLQASPTPASGGEVEFWLPT